MLGRFFVNDTEFQSHHSIPRTMQELLGDIRPPLTDDVSTEMMVMDIISTTTAQLDKYAASKETVHHLRRTQRATDNVLNLGYCVILLFGTDARGNSITAAVPYSPFVYVQIPFKFIPRAEAMFKKIVKHVRKRCEREGEDIENFDLHYEVVLANRFFGFSFDSRGPRSFHG